MSDRPPTVPDLGNLLHQAEGLRLKAQQAAEASASAHAVHAPVQQQLAALAAEEATARSALAEVARQLIIAIASYFGLGTPVWPPPAA